MSSGKGRPSSHRLRLTLTVSLAFGLILAVLFALAAGFYRSLDEHSADSELATVLNAMASEFRVNASAHALEDTIHTPRGPSACIFDPSGKKVAQYGSMRLENVAARGLRRMGGFLVRYQSTEVRGHRIVVGDNWEDVEQAHWRLNLILAATWIPLTFGVGLITWMSVTRTFRPLLAMAEEAERLSTSGPGSRLAVPADAEFGSLASRLNLFLDRLESNVKTQERFVADAAHELRTPLTILRGQAETALLRERTASEYAKVLSVIVDESARLANLMDSLLVSSSVSNPPSEPQELAVVVQEAVDRWQPRFKDKEVFLRSAIHPTQAMVKEREVDTVLNNLLDNALRHSPVGSRCQVTLRSVNGLAELAVSDQGPGVPDESKERIFDRFFRTDAGRSRAEGGFGIGLSICKRIVSQTEGKILVKDNSPSGTVFVVSWPRGADRFRPPVEDDQA